MLFAAELAKSGEAAKSGPIGLAIILILCIVCYFLFKSMSRHLRRVREEFPGAERAATDQPAAPAAPAAPTAKETAPPTQRSEEPPAQ